MSSRWLRSERAIFFMGSMRERIVCRAPLVEEFSGPARRTILPELLKGLFQKVGADGLEIVAEEIAQPEVLGGAKVLTATEQQPAGFPEDRARPSGLMRLVSSARTLSSAFFIWRRRGSGRGYAAPRSSFRGSASDRAPTCGNRRIRFWKLRSCP